MTIAEQHRQAAEQHNAATERERREFDAFMASRGFGGEPANYDLDDPAYRARLAAVREYTSLPAARRSVAVVTAHPKIVATSRAVPSPAVAAAMPVRTATNLQPMPVPFDADAAADGEAARILGACFDRQSEPDLEAERLLTSVFGPRTASAVPTPRSGTSSGIAAADALVARSRRAAAGGARAEAEDPEARRILASVFGGEPSDG